MTATPPQTTRYTQATPYPNTGVISWTNVGPIYPGGSKLITVTFKVLEPSAITQTFINTATVYGGQYGNGRPTNDARDDATSPVSRTTSIGDFIWRDLNSNGVQDVGEPGIPGVVISLTANVAYTYSNGVNIPAGTVVTTTTDVNGYYLFDGIRNAGTFTTRVNTSTLPTGGGAFTQTGDPDQPNVTCTHVRQQLQRCRHQSIHQRHLGRLRLSAALVDRRHHLERSEPQRHHHARHR